MKLCEMRFGQTLAVTFPYSEEPERKYGFRVVEVGHSWVRVLNVKTGKMQVYGEPGLTYDPDKEWDNWRLLESSPV